MILRWFTVRNGVHCPSWQFRSGRGIGPVRFVNHTTGIISSFVHVGLSLCTFLFLWCESKNCYRPNTSAILVGCGSHLFYQEFNAWNRSLSDCSNAWSNSHLAFSLQGSVGKTIILWRSDTNNSGSKHSHRFISLVVLTIDCNSWGNRWIVYWSKIRIRKFLHNSINRIKIPLKSMENHSGALRNWKIDSWKKFEIVIFSMNAIKLYNSTLYKNMQELRILYIIPRTLCHPPDTQDHPCNITFLYSE